MRSHTSPSACLSPVHTLSIRISISTSGALWPNRSLGNWQTRREFGYEITPNVRLPGMRQTDGHDESRCSFARIGSVRPNVSTEDSDLSMYCDFSSHVKTVRFVVLRRTKGFPYLSAARDFFQAEGGSKE
eukprot:366115-Pleurochrysis_carterae.AAC.2